MSGKPTPIFVQRRTYRRRRLADAARLLPVLGAVLVMIPLLWQGDGRPDGGLQAASDGGRTAWVMTYFFFVWLGLAVLSGVLSRYLSAEDHGAGDDEVR